MAIRARIACIAVRDDRIILMKKLALEWNKPGAAFRSGGRSYLDEMARWYA